MSSDIDEVGEEFECGSGSVSPGLRSPNEYESGGKQKNSSGGRRGSLPCDRPSSTIRRHLQQFRTRRKVSAPCAQQQPTRSAASSPLESLSGYPLAELLERLKPAYTGSRHPSIADSGVSEELDLPSRYRRYSCGSETTTKDRKSGSVDEGFHSIDESVKRPLFVDTKLANVSSGSLAPATVPRRCLYYRQSSVSGVVDEASHFPRARSNSEAGRYLLMRKCGDRGSEFVGKLDEGEWAYCQILANLKCYDLMPGLAKMVVFDSNLPFRKAFLAFVHNNIRAAPIWDGHKKLFVGLLTVTDLMRMLIEYAGEYGNSSPSNRKNGKNFEETLDLPLHTRTTTCVQRTGGSDSPNYHANFGHRHSVTTGGVSTNQHQPYHLNHLIYALADETVAKAAKLLCDRRLHRLLILDPEKGGNPLFLLSKKDVLKALRKYIAKLPLPPCMEKTLDELTIGTWSDLITVSSTTTIHEALSLFLNKGLSALPVVDEQFRILDMLTKVDVMNLVIENQGPVDGILRKSVQDALKNRSPGSEKMTTCSKKATLMLAVECILHSEAHRLAIVDLDGRLQGVLALADLSRFLTVGFPFD